MILRFRVSLPGIKGFFRVYDLKPTTTLYDFHKRMRDDMEFPHDQLIQFKALGADGSLVARYGMFDLGHGAVDVVTVSDTVKKGVASFQYFYDIPERKSVIVTFEGNFDEVPGVSYPCLSESKGPNPIEFENGYVAYEDLPDEQRHLPGEPGWPKDKKEEKKPSLLDILAGGDDDFADDDEEDDDEENDDREEEQIIYDGSEDLNF